MGKAETQSWAICRNSFQDLLMVDKCHLSFQSHQYAIERDLEGNPPTIEDEDFEGSRWKPLVSPPLQTFHWLPSAYRALKRVAMGKGGEVPFKGVCI